MQIKHVAALTLVCVLTSCSFNHQFLRPGKVPTNKEQAFLKNSQGDTIMVMHLGVNHQPSFTTNTGTPVAQDYTIESIVLDNKNKTHKITGWFLKPAKVQPDITLLLLHGNGGNILTEYLGAAEFVKRGMQVFIIDYSGYGFSEGKATWKNVWKDAGVALQYLHNRKDVQGTLLAIYGQSYGGYTAIPLAQKYESLINGVITEGAPTSRKDIGAHQTNLGIIAKALIKEKHSALKAITKYHKPVLIIQSDEDEIIPFRMGQQLYACAHEPKAFYRIHGPHLAGLANYADSIAYHVRRTVKP